MHLHLNISNVKQHFFSQFIDGNSSLFLDVLQFTSVFVSGIFELALEISLLFEELFGVQFPILNIFQLLSLFRDFSFFVIMLDHEISIKLSKVFIVVIQIHLLCLNEFFCLFYLFFYVFIISIYIICLILDTLVVPLLSDVVSRLKDFTFASEFLIVCYQKFSSILHLENGDLVVNCFLFDVFVLT